MKKANLLEKEEGLLTRRTSYKEGVRVVEELIRQCSSLRRYDMRVTPQVETRSFLLMTRLFRGSQGPLSFYFGTLFEECNGERLQKFKEYECT